MLSSWSFSQNIPKKIEIEKSTLISIVKESKKCDSLRVAYTFKTIQLDGLIQSNLNMFQELEEQRALRIEAEIKLQNQIKVYKKKNNKNSLLFTAGGAILGFTVGALIIN